ncbi:MAG: TfoX/Sxy family protein [Deferribacteraceae bacterium]|jgi:DNA transformation protein|nr:TfoX/Sxy family protein [Deferribacteraceae bacterium]
MSALAALPNVGKVLENNLIQIGVETPEQLRAIGAQEAFMRIRTQVDQGACLHMLYGIQAAIDNVPKKLLPLEIKDELKVFYNTLR